MSTPTPPDLTRDRDAVVAASRRIETLTAEIDALRRARLDAAARLRRSGVPVATVARWAGMSPSYLARAITAVVDD